MSIRRSRSVGANEPCRTSRHSPSPPSANLSSSRDPSPGPEPTDLNSSNSNCQEQLRGGGENPSKTMFLIQKYTQYKATQAEQQKRKVTEKELAQLNHKIDKLLTKLDEHEPEIAVNQDEECVVCVTAKATMQTYPCGHRVVCRKCFVKTIQMAVAQRLLPLRCVICRAKILRLKHSTGSMQSLPASASQYTIGHSWYNVPQSASLYSVTSNTSAASAASSASSCSSSSSYKTCASSFSSASFRKTHSGYSKLGYKPLRTTSPSPSRSPQPRSSLAMAIAKKDNRVAPAEATVPLKGKLSLIQEFRREFSIGKEQSSSSSSKDHPKLKLHSSKGSCSSHQISQHCGGPSVRSNK
ncbi:unnamed protein product [Allacma fusca]|uniref:RING-type domain-containing protein n=1 Tax=Allacma fusca TaxID=39272 RepID=A0A8J2J8E4_9HEXA|nr:unnamed protein product [Allacma fusca]